jgi:hypothetical protein
LKGIGKSSKKSIVFHDQNYLIFTGEAAAIIGVYRLDKRFIKTLKTCKGSHQHQFRIGWIKFEKLFVVVSQILTPILSPYIHQFCSPQKPF